MAAGTITLGNVADRTDALNIACSRCDRSGLNFYDLCSIHRLGLPALYVPGPS